MAFEAMIGKQTQRVVDFLSDPRSYPHQPAEVHLIQTHASWVFIAPPLVYKIKKPVNFGFLDFTTLELRKADCERELLLNRRLAPDVYLGLEAVRQCDGALGFTEQGAVVEWVVKMREMDSRFFLNRLLHQPGAFNPSDMERLVNTLHQFYITQPPPPPAETEQALERIQTSTQGNFDATCPFVGQSLSASALAAIGHYSCEFQDRQSSLLAARVRNGWIRDCHGDLHLEHIHVTADAIRIFDCVEFNKDFRFIDVASDLAFLAMDLDFNHRPDLADDLIERFAALFQDTELKPLMDFYKCYRACVRGKVESLLSNAATAPVAEKEASLDLARRYFRLALHYAVNGSKPRAIVIMGQVASGKSALAEALAAETEWPIVSSDRLRKTMAKVPLHRRGTQDERAELYSPQMTRRVYTEIGDRVLQSLRGYRPMIVDATFSRRHDRDSLRQLLDSEGFGATWIEAHASDSLTQVRLRLRETTDGVVSDARIEDFERLRRSYEPPSELAGDTLLRADTASTTGEALHELLTQMADRRASSAWGGAAIDAPEKD